MVFFSEITNIWQRSLDLWFANCFLGIFKIHMLVWIFLWIFGFQRVLFKVITNLKFYKHCFITDGFQKHFWIIGWCLERQRNPYARPYGFKIFSLDRNPRLWLDSWQSLETFAKITSVISISGKISACLCPPTGPSSAVRLKASTIKETSRLLLLSKEECKPWNKISIENHTPFVVVWYWLIDLSSSKYWQRLYLPCTNDITAEVGGSS